MAEDFRKECSSLMNVSGAHRSIPSVLAAFALLSAILVVGGDAQTDSLPGIATIHVSTDVIEVPVLAFKPPFRRVSGLLSEDFLIRLDGGSSFHPRYVHVEGLEPLSLGVLVDAEVRDTKILSVSLQNGMRHLSPDFVSDIDRWSVYLSGCRLVRTMNYGQIHSSTNRDPWMEAFSTSSFQAASQGDSTCHPPAVDQAIGAGIAQLALTFGWRVLLVLVNENQKIAIHALDDLRAKAAAGGVTLFVIRYPDRASFPKATDAETDGFHLLSSSLGGISVFSSFEDFGQVIEEIIAAMRGRYILGFSRPANGNGGVHSLQVTTRKRGVKVLASAASAPLLDDTSCTASKEGNLCSSDRPNYGTKRPPP